MVRNLLGRARILGRIVAILGWLVVVAGIALLLVPSLLGFDRYVIVSGSMHPNFDRGSVVFSKAVNVDDLKVGDVITYTPPPATGVNHLVTHRISEIKVDENGGRMYRTKGDANPGNDPWTFSLIGQKQNVMHFSVPYVGHGLLALQNPKLRMAVIGVPAALIAFGALLDLVADPIRNRVRARRPEPEVA
jgi:signal peptidase